MVALGCSRGSSSFFLSLFLIPALALGRPITVGWERKKKLSPFSTHPTRTWGGSTVALGSLFGTVIAMQMLGLGFSFAEAVGERLSGEGKSSWGKGQKKLATQPMLESPAATPPVVISDRVEAWLHWVGLGWLFLSHSFNT